MKDKASGVEVYFLSADLSSAVVLLSWPWAPPHWFSLGWLHSTPFYQLPCLRCNLFQPTLHTTAGKTEPKTVSLYYSPRFQLHFAPRVQSEFLCRAHRPSRSPGCLPPPPSPQTHTAAAELPVALALCNFGQAFPTGLPFFAFSW